MIPTLFRWMTGGSQIWLWTAVAGAMALWWVVLWSLTKLLRLESLRPPRVVAEARLALFLVGVIFVFNLALVPVVLVAFHGVAGICLLTCAAAAVVYLIRVDDRESAEPASIAGAASRGADGPLSDPFASPKRGRRS